MNMSSSNAVAQWWHPNIAALAVPDEIFIINRSGLRTRIFAYVDTIRPKAGKDRDCACVHNALNKYTQIS